MNQEAVKLELDELELELVASLNYTQEELKSLNNIQDNLSKDIKAKAIDTIATVFGLSDLSILKDGGMHNTISEYNDALNDDKKSKNLSATKFKELKEFSETHSYNRKEMEAKEFSKNVKSIRNDNPDTIESGYEDKTFVHGDNYEYDHLISLNEVSKNKAHMFFIGDKKISEIFNEKDFNVFAISKDLNREKGSMTLTKFVDYLDKPNKTDPTKTNAEFHNIDKVKLNTKVSQIINKQQEIDKTLVWKTGKESLSVAGTNALKGGAKLVIGKVLIITINEVVDGIKSTEDISIKQRIENIVNEIKVKAKDIIKDFKDFSITSFISTFVEGIIKSVFKTLKNAYKFIKSILLSVVKSIKVLFDGSLSKEEKNAKVLSILKNTFTVMIGLALYEGIKIVLQQIPLLGSYSSILSDILSALIVGIGGMLLVGYFNDRKKNIEIRSLKEQELQQLGQLTEVSKLKITKQAVETFKMLQATTLLSEQVIANHQENMNKIEENNEYFNTHYNEIEFRLQESQKDNEDDDLWDIINQY